MCSCLAKSSLDIILATACTVLQHLGLSSPTAFFASADACVLVVPSGLAPGSAEGPPAGAELAAGTDMSPGAREAPVASGCVLDGNAELLGAAEELAATATACGQGLIDSPRNLSENTIIP